MLRLKQSTRWSYTLEYRHLWLCRTMYRINNILNMLKRFHCGRGLAQYSFLLLFYNFFSSLQRWRLAGPTKDIHRPVLKPVQPCLRSWALEKVCAARSGFLFPQSWQTLHSLLLKKNIPIAWGQHQHWVLPLRWNWPGDEQQLRVLRCLLGNCKLSCALLLE